MVKDIRSAPFARKKLKIMKLTLYFLFLKKDLICNEFSKGAKV
jgi:hypothetical protein